ncbi:NAD(P)/FAD-dependent oxidoreductase [Nicoliella lavandulae]|uniref:FAD-dependent oxidoreductase n=1 Tax=Nicoliella lavandulae TaxID=3082954 RepID=A0ABU8SMZ2_9LACO
MTRQKVAIVGGGIMGSTVAYYLTTHPNWQDFEVTMFDDGMGQATKAAAGIISPWMSKRRNQRWYRLARMGADLIHQLAVETKMDASMYQQNGTIITRDTAAKIDQLLQLARQREVDAPLMGTLTKLSADEINQLIPMVENQLPGLLVSGGAMIDGGRFAHHLRSIAEQHYFSSKKQKVTLTKIKNKIKINQETFNKVMICTGAWMKDTIAPLGFDLKVRPQKGQLIKIKLNQPVNKNYMPVLMPEGERDFIPINNHEIIIGATHENDMGFDLNPSDEAFNDLLASAKRLMPNITKDNIELIRVGTRAYTDDFAPYFGALPGLDNVLIGGGLGSSGLTTGPMIAKLLAESVITGSQKNWSEYTKPIDNYLN